MIIYNVTIKIDKSIENSWLKWMQQIHIPDIINTKCFTHATILYLLENDESDGVTYAVQFHSTSKELYEKYLFEFAPTMRKHSIDKWGNKFVAFRSVLQIVN